MEPAALTTNPRVMPLHRRTARLRRARRGLTPAGALLFSAFSVLLFTWVLALRLPLLVAAGVAVVLIVHEAGHYIMIRLRGLRAGVPVFVPFLGAIIELRDPPRDALEESLIGYAGPLAGTVAAAGAGALYAAGAGDGWAAVAFAGAVLNGVNMLPLRPLDGGRILAAVTPWSWVVGLPLVMAAALGFAADGAVVPMFLLGFVVWNFVRHLRLERSMPEGLRARFYDVPLPVRAVVAALYAGLIGLQVGLGWASAEPAVRALGIVVTDGTVYEESFPGRSDADRVPVLPPGRPPVYRKDDLSPGPKAPPLRLPPGHPPIEGFRGDDRADEPPLFRGAGPGGSI